MHDHTGPEPRSAQEIHGLWKELVTKPGVFTDMAEASREQRVMFAAGGGLPQQFGKAESKIWQGIEAAAQNGRVTIAGVEFATADLAEMGEFYRSLRGKGIVFHCIDERLVEDEAHLANQVHEACGACNATGATTGLAAVDDMLLGELHESELGKQGIYADMGAHTSLVISVDLAGGKTVLGEARQALKEGQGLAFNVSIPLSEVAAFAEEKGLDAAKLVKTLVKWNVQIARNIIGGDHNTLKEQAQHTMVVVHAHGVADEHLLEMTREALAHVQHGEMLTL